MFCFIFCSTRWPWQFGGNVHLGETSRHSSLSMVLGKSSTSSLNEGILHLMGMSASVPYTSWKGVNPVVVLIDVQYAQSAENSAKCQLDLFFPIILWIMVFRNRLTTST